MMLPVIIILVGIFIGIISSIIGTGGGFLFVPFLYLVIGLDLREAIGTSAFATIFTAASSFYTYSRKGYVNYKVGIILEAATYPGVYLGVVFSYIVTEDILEVVLSVILILISINLLFKNQQKTENIDDKDPNAINWKRVYMLMPIQFFVGFIAGSIGISGGIMKSPLMIIVAQISVRVAVGTASFMALFTAILSALGHFIYGKVNPIIGSLLGIGAVIGAQIGSRKVVKVNPKVIRRIISLILICVALRMLIF